MNYLKRIINKIFRKKINNYRIYSKALKGKDGLEIGGPSGIFKKLGIVPIYAIINSLDDFSFPTPVERGGRILKSGRAFQYCYGKKTGNQFIGDALDLSPVGPKRYDFVLASHVLEHIANPLKALTGWMKILKDDGVLLLAVPDKKFIFDHKRPVTSLGHLIEDFKKNIGENDLSHLKEILELTDISMDSHVPDEAFLKARALCNSEHRNLHHHVFDTNLMVEIMKYLNLKVLSVDVAPPHHIIILAKKE